MFREMRRGRQALSREETEAMLRGGSSGVLALAGDDGYPYAVPVSYVYTDGRLYFHGAPAGHKYDAVRRCGRASFCVVAQDSVLPEKFTTCYRSAIAFGRIRVLEDEAARRAAIGALAEKYSPGDEAGQKREIAATFGRLCLLELTVEHLTGKACIELVREREGL